MKRTIITLLLCFSAFVVSAQQSTEDDVITLEDSSTVIITQFDQGNSYHIITDTSDIFIWEGNNGKNGYHVESGHEFHLDYTDVEKILYYIRRFGNN